MVWAPGNCASVRLARQLGSDCAVLKIEAPDQEWYYPLLQPKQHYAAVWANASGIGLAQTVEWANNNPAGVSQTLSMLRHSGLSLPLSLSLSTQQKGDTAKSRRSKYRHSWQASAQR